MSARIRRIHVFLKVLWGTLFGILASVGLPRPANAQGCPAEECLLLNGFYTCTTSKGQQYCTNNYSSCTDTKCPPAPHMSMLGPRPLSQFEKPVAVKGCVSETLADLEKQGGPHDGIQMGMLDAEPNAPVSLVLATYGVRDLFLRGRIINDSRKVVSSYRVGWAFQFSTGLKFHVGEWMNIPAGLKPGAFQDVPPQNVSSNGLANAGVTGVKFFVAEVKYADGSHWKPNLKMFRKIQSVSHARASL